MARRFIESFATPLNSSVTATALGTTPQSIFFDGTGLLEGEASPTIQGAYGSNVSGKVGEYIDAEIVRAFIVSPEYRTRFGIQ